MDPSQAIILYEAFNQLLRKAVPVETGIFRENMVIHQVNDGPLSILYES
jgi:D-Tyr-tRNAtyr deacylase